MIFVNFKRVVTRESAVVLAKICQEVEKETSIKIIPVAQPIDVARISSLGIEVWSQAVLAPQAAGVLLNHSDNRLSLETIKKEVSSIKKQVLRVMVCCESVEEGKQIAEFCRAELDFLAYEPPELIGGNISVSTARPEIITDLVKQIPEIPIIVGAGIHNQADVKKAIELGSKGILVSHAVVEAEEPKAVLLDLAKGFTFRYSSGL